ncbi:WD repeat-containing protein 25-like [Anneissia japonica]|uniref:WD repeat-containing protein 25-like n=1 Tax=Anneissia japonica TaxID=1529436 RepID=UPI0014256EA3|nr:WD repeat-containing protein 25-like [Anneissia japonica]
MDILQGYESGDSTEDTSHDPCSDYPQSKSCNSTEESSRDSCSGHPKSTELEKLTADNDQKNKSFESVDFFSLTSTEIDREIGTLENDFSSTSQKCHINMSRSGNQQPFSTSSSENTGMPRGIYCSEVSRNECSIVNVPESYTCRNQNNVATRRKAKRHQEWNRSNEKTFEKCENRHSAFTDDIQPYVPKKKKTTFVPEEKDKDSASKPFIPNMFTTPTLIAANLENTPSQLPKTKYITFSDAHSAAVTHTRWNIPRYSHLFLSASFDKTVKIWDCVDINTCVASITSHQNGVKDAQWSKCGRQILSGGFDHSVQLHDVETGTPYHSIHSASSDGTSGGEKYTCPCLKVHPKENVFLAQSNGNYIAMFSCKRPYKLNKFKRFEGHKIEGYPIGFDYSPDGNIITSGSSDGCVYFYSYKTSKLIKKLKCDGDNICTDVAYHPVLPGVMVTCSWEGSVSVWQ